MKQSFWNNKNVLVTGAGGFLGTALDTRLTSLGATVCGVSRTARQNSVIVADVASKRQMEVFFAKRNLYACFHLAAEALVEHGKASPYTTFKNNILGTLNVLELSKLYRVPRIVVSSTVHVYGDAPAPTAEHVSPRPSRPYETSKTCADLIAQSYADSYHLPVLIPRFVNVYGPADMNFSRLVPKTIRSVLMGQRPTLWGGDVKRDFLYVDDAIRAFLLLAEIDNFVLEKNRIFNFGTGEIVSVAELMQKIIVLAGVNTDILHVENEREQEIPQQYVNWDKAKKVLSWRPETELSEGLRRTIRWYREHLTI